MWLWTRTCSTCSCAPVQSRGGGANRVAIGTSRASDTTARSLIVYLVRPRSRMDNADWLSPIWAARVSWRAPHRAIQARTSAATLTLSSSTAVSSAARRQAVRSALARTRLADQVRFPPDASSPLSTPGCLLALIHSPLSHRLIDRYELHFMICIRIPARLNMADHDTTWGLT
jgi:hypothetical protein